MLAQIPERVEAHVLEAITAVVAAQKAFRALVREHGAFHSDAKWQVLPKFLRKEKNPHESLMTNAQVLSAILEFGTPKDDGVAKKAVTELRTISRACTKTYFWAYSLIPFVVFDGPEAVFRAIADTVPPDGIRNDIDEAQYPKGAVLRCFWTCLLQRLRSDLGGIEKYERLLNDLLLEVHDAVNEGQFRRIVGLEGFAIHVLQGASQTKIPQVEKWLEDLTATAQKAGTDAEFSVSFVEQAYLLLDLCLLPAGPYEANQLIHLRNLTLPMLLRNRKDGQDGLWPGTASGPYDCPNHYYSTAVCTRALMAYLRVQQNHSTGELFAAARLSLG